MAGLVARARWAIGALGRFRELVASDMYRYQGRTGLRAALSALREPGFRYTLVMRTTGLLASLGPVAAPARVASSLLLGHLRYRYGIDVPPNADIGPGLYIGHFGNIVVHPDAKIGESCNLSQGVTIGQTNRGERAGVPIIGDHVYIGPGAKIIGRIRVGSHAAIGANCVVTRDVPDHGVVVGVPGRVVSMEGSEGYVRFTDYPRRRPPRP